ncbi:MAG: thiamine phosphate synthase [Candidatus Dormibacteraceae bacterium]
MSHLGATPPPTTLEDLRRARLYALTPDATPARIEELVDAWCRGGVDVVQLRHKSLHRGALLPLAERLAARCRQAGVLFFVNDHLDIALLSGADGVHLGEEDLSLADAERAMRNAGSPRILVGASTSGVEQARKAEQGGADCLGAGPAYPTPIKPGKPALGLPGVRAIQDAVGIPVFAIGGVDATRIAELREQGLGRVCVIRALSDDPDPEAAARRLRELLYA